VVVVKMVGTKAHDNHELAWPVERINWLKDLWIVKRLSASQIGRLFGLSRSAILGKVFRLGLSGTRKKPVTARITARPRHVVPTGRRMKAATVVVDAVEADIVEAPFLNRTIDKIALGECHYPHGDHTPFLFCGQPVQEGSWYCPHHHRLSYHAPDPSRRRDLGVGHGLAQWRGVR
jgi:GcrA cell cycle regulator